MPSEEPKAQFARIVDALRRYGVEFIVIGGQAEVLMGSPRVTYDSDFTYHSSRENLKRLAQALNDLKARPRDFPSDLPFVLDATTLDLGTTFTFQTTQGALDLLKEVEPIGRFDEVARNSETYDYLGQPLRTIGLKDLIRVKRHINRPKDRDSLFQLAGIEERREREARGEKPY